MLIKLIKTFQVGWNLEAVENFSALNRFALKCSLFYSEKLMDSSDMMEE